MPTNPEYVNDAVAAAKANAKASGNKFSGSMYDYYKYPNNADGVLINEMEESAIKANYKSFTGSQAVAACRALNISYSKNNKVMNKAQLQSTLDDYFDGKEGKISISMFAIVVIAVH